MGLLTIVLLECTRQKVRCDKKDPCTRCVRRSTECVREIVRISKANTVHREELDFLRRLAEQLETSQDVNDTLSDLRHRIRSLEHGPLATTEPLASTTSQLTLDTRPSASQKSESAARYCSLPSFSNESPALAAATTTSQRGSDVPGHTPSGDNRDDRREHASKIGAIEFLAWGRHTGKCFPHRLCECRSVRPYAEIVSINADPSWIGIQRLHHELPPTVQISVYESRSLVEFHFDHILWHHNVFHAPTFLMQCEEFWSAGTVHHPLWAALYLSVLAVSSWTVLNSKGLQAGMYVNEAMVTDLFRAMVSVLYDGNFLENLSLYSIQAITLSTRIAHNLGLSDFNATIVGAAIRIGHCLGLHRIANDNERTAITTSEDWYRVVETEVGRRCWLQLIIQDYFQVPFTETYMIQPSHFSTGLPRNCHDEDMIDQDDQVPTINSYIRTLSRIALLMPPFLDGLGHAQGSYSLDKAYSLVVSSEIALRALIKDIPTFFLRQPPTDTNTSTRFDWIAVARRSLSISVADKIIMIHRPVIFHAFQAPTLSRTRNICVSAARTILREHEAVTNEDAPSLWTHSAFCVTAAMVVGLELLFRDVHTDGEASTLRAALNDTAVRLRTRKCDVIAERGAALIDAFIEIEEQLVIKVMRLSLYGASARSVQLDLVNELIDKNDIIAKFLALSPQKPGANSAQMEAVAGEVERWSHGFPSDFPLGTELLDMDLFPDYLPPLWDIES
ncbi:hypothetical protein BJX99DRAFT_205017 [Aspergillus californicus]